MEKNIENRGTSGYPGEHLDYRIKGVSEELKVDELIRQLCPQGVEKKHLGDICEVRSGWSFPEEYQNQKVGKIPFYKVKDTNLEGNEMKMYSSDHYLTPQDVKDLKVNLAPKGTIILPKVGLTIRTNKKRLLTQDSGYDNNLVGLIADSSKVSSSYLYHWVMNQDIIEWSNKSGAVPSIRTSTIKSLLVPLPPFEVQKEILDILDSFTELIENLKREIELRKQAYVGQSNILFDHVKHEHPSLRLDEIATIYSGDTPRAKEKSYWGGPISWITPKDVSDGKMFIEQGERSITQEGFDSCSAKMLPEGSILMTSRAPVGNVAIAKKKLCTNQGMKSLVLNEDQDTSYWYHALVHAKRRIQDASTTGTFSEISKTAFSRLEFYTPPLEVQQEIGATLGDLSTYIERLEEELDLRKKQYTYALDRLFDLPRFN